jgi:hypothetical protein
VDEHTLIWHNLFCMNSAKWLKAAHTRESSRLLRIFSLLLLVFAVRASAAAEEASVVTFTLDFPGSEPSHYAIAVSPNGRSSYDSDGKLSKDAEGEPFHLEFSMSPDTSKRVFELAEKAQYFQGKVDSGKKNLASTGAKTLAYKDSGKNTSATYNYSLMPAVQQLTQLFQSLSATLEYGRRLQYFHRYQKLALDEELKRMEEAANNKTLQTIATDQSVINPVRARAQRMIEQAGPPKR